MAWTRRRRTLDWLAHRIGSHDPYMIFDPKQPSALDRLSGWLCMLASERTARWLG